MEREKKTLKTVIVVQTNSDRTISILVDDIPWRVEHKTLEKMKQSTLLRGGV